MKFFKKFNKTQKVISSLLIILSLITTIAITLYGLWANELQFTSVSLEVDPTEVEIGQTFTLTSTIGGNGNEIVDNMPFVFKIHSTNIIFTNFDDNGDYKVVLESGEEITYHIEYYDTYTEITSSPISQGDTIATQLKGYFNPETTKNREETKIELIYEGEVIKETTVTPISNINWDDNKTGPDSITCIKDDNNLQLDGTVKYKIEAIVKENIDNLPKDSIITSAIMKDTITFPRGIGIKLCPEGQSEREYLISALGLNDIADKNLQINPTYSDEGYIKAVDFTWEENTTDENNQLNSIYYEFTLNNDCLYLDENISSDIIINNKLSSECKTLLDSTINTKEKSVDTKVIIKDISDYIDDFTKKIIDFSNDTKITIDEWGNVYGYVMNGDYVVYEINYKYNGPNISSITLKDILPHTMVLASDDEIKNVSFNKSQYEKATGSNNENVEISKDDEGNVVWIYKDVKTGDILHAYIIARVNENISEWVENKAQIGNKFVSSWIEEKASNDSVSVEKTNSYTGITPAKEYEYTIKIKNTGTILATDRILKDKLPDEVEYISSSISYAPENSTIDNLRYENGEILADNISIPVNGYIEIKINVKTKDNIDSKSFKNTVYIYLKDKLESESTVENKETDSQIENGDIIFDKKVDKATVGTNEELKYYITLYNNTAQTIDFSDKPYVITDKLPEQVIYVSSFYTLSQGSGNKFTDGIEISSDTLTWTYSGKLKPYETAKLEITCKTKENLESGKIINTAILNNIEKTVSTDIIKKEDNLIVTKDAYLEDGTQVSNGEINKGETTFFRIKIENPSNSSTTYNELRFLDEILNAAVSHPNYQQGVLNIKVIQKNDKVKGFTNEGDILTLKNMWSSYITSFNFVITNKSESKNEYNTIYYNENFALEPGGFIILEYGLDLRDEFIKMENKITVNEKFEDSTGILTTAKIPTLKIEKESITKAIAADDLEDYIFEYNIKISNISSKKDAYINTFTITDLIPDGMLLAPRWYGDTGFFCEVFYSKGGYNLWDNSKGGQYYAHIVNNNLVIEFGSKSDTGSQTLIELGPGEYYNIKLKLKFSDEKIKYYQDLEKNKEMPSGGIRVQNTAILKSENEFINEDNEKVTEITSKDYFDILPTTYHPGIKKEALGYYLGKYNGNYIKYNESTANNVSPGDTIIWRIIISNDKVSTQNKDITKYNVKDIIPKHYTYDWEYKKTDSELYVMKIVHDDNTEDVFDYVVPSMDEDNNIYWDFSDEKYTLKPGDKLFIEFPVINDGTNSFGICNNIAELTIEGGIPGDIITSGEIIDEDTISFTATVNIALFKTSSYKTITSYKKGEVIEIGIGTDEEQNVVYGYKGDYVKYELIIKNESTARLNNFTIIDRLPYVGDIGVVTSYPRNSAFKVRFDKFISVIVENSDGTTEDITVNSKLTFSDNSTEVFGDNAIDWDGTSNGVANWHDEITDNDCNIRIYLEDTIIKPGATIKISFTGYIPDNIDISGKENIAWNNFGYAYSNIDATSTTMIAEPAKVGVWVDGNVENEFYSIEILKVNKSKNPLTNVEFRLINDSTKEGYIMITDENGKIIFENLPAGEYTLTETKAATGYELLQNSIKIVLNEENTDNNIYFLEIINEPTIKMPATGSTTMLPFLFIGFIVILVIAIILLIQRKRKLEKSIEI